MDDVYKIVAMAEGKGKSKKIASTDLSYSYSAAELKEIIDILKKLLK